MKKIIIKIIIDSVFVISITVLTIASIYLTSQFIVKNGFMLASDNDVTQLAEVYCIEVFKPQPVSTLMASK